jgi:hypothetical protein
MSRWIEDAPITSHGDRDVDHRSVLREPLRLIAPDIIAPHQAIEDRLLLARRSAGTSTPTGCPTISLAVPP